MKYRELDNQIHGHLVKIKELIAKHYAETNSLGLCVAGNEKDNLPAQTDMQADYEDRDTERLNTELRGQGLSIRLIVKTYEEYEG